jgi:hypothetical protein
MPGAQTEDGLSQTNISFFATPACVHQGIFSACPYGLSLPGFRNTFTRSLCSSGISLNLQISDEHGPGRGAV